MRGIRGGNLSYLGVRREWLTLFNTRWIAVILYRLLRLYLNNIDVQISGVLMTSECTVGGRL